MNNFVVVKAVGGALDERSGDSALRTSYPVWDDFYLGGAYVKSKHHNPAAKVWKHNGIFYNIVRQ